MLCVRYARRNNVAALLNLFLKKDYSRRGDNTTSSYKLFDSNGETVDDLDGSVLGTNSNWELLTPRGFRFYLPGSVGPGWSDVSTTVQVSSKVLDFGEKLAMTESPKELTAKHKSSAKRKFSQPILSCVAQECPLLLRRGIGELFAGYVDVGSLQLTVVTIGQKANFKMMKCRKEVETEKLAKYFILAASDICAKLKMIGYWADFINPFSGQPHLSGQKSNTLYKTDQRFRCLGFKIDSRNNCKVISHDSNMNNFVGNLYTTAPASMDFLKEILNDCSLIQIDPDE